MKRVAALVVAAALALPAALGAQEAQTPQAPAIDASKMGVSLDRIRRGLVNEPLETMTSDGTGRLSIRIDVFGLAPPINVLPEDFSLSFGPVPGSAPTHREHIEFVTPEDFKSPPVPIYGLAVWAAQKLIDRSKKSRCEQEVADYRAMVMQGIAVAAPRCTQ
jgi:hypothetical protein